MTRLYAGTKAGVGPVLKIMADETDDPLTTSNTAYEKFRFNSEIQALAYAYEVTDYVIDHSVYPFLNSGVVTREYFPAGSGNSTFELAINGTGVYSYGYIDLDRACGLPYRAMAFFIKDADAWTTNFVASSFAYTGSNDTYYAAYYDNEVVSTQKTERPQAQIYAGLQFSRGVAFYPFNPNFAGSPVAGRGTQINSDFFVVGNVTYYSPGETPAVQAVDRIMFWELPIDDDPYPAVVGTPAPDKKILKISPTEVKLAKPGFDVESATEDQLILSSDRIPVKVASAGTFTLAPGTSIAIPVAYPITPRCVCLNYVQVAGQPLFIPPLSTDFATTVAVQYRIVGQTLEFRNQSAAEVEVRYALLADDAQPQQAGTAKIIEKLPDGTIKINRPGSAGVSNRDVILDSRAFFPPIIAQGWVPVADIVEASNWEMIGTHMYRVTLPTGDFKPLVLAQIKFNVRSGPGGPLLNKFAWSPPFIKKPAIYSFCSGSSFIITLTDDQVTFYCDRNGARIEDAYRIGVYYGRGTIVTPVGIRYFVLAVPPSI